MGVPWSGKYKEIFNSDDRAFGGSGAVNPRVKIARKEEWDELPYSVKVKVPPLGIAIFSYSRAVEKAVDNKTAKRKKKETASPGKNLKKELEEKMEAEEKAAGADKKSTVEKEKK